MDRRPHIWMVLVVAAFAILLADAAPFAKKVKRSNILKPVSKMCFKFLERGCA